MSNFDLYCMKESIAIACKDNFDSLHVGIVLTTNNQILFSCTTNKNSKSAWLKKTIQFLKQHKIEHVETIYITINTMSHGRKFDLSELLSIVSADKIYIGLPDPTLYNYEINDPFLNIQTIRQYPDDLLIEIYKQNEKIYKKSKQNINLSPYYSDIRISNLIQQYLKNYGIIITKDNLNLNKSVEKLSHFIQKTNKLTYNKAKSIVDKALSEAFNYKYSNYDYCNDSRSLNTNWIQDFYNIISSQFSKGIDNKRVLNIGVGSGKESIELFSQCSNCTFVDIASGGLKNIAKVLPNAILLKSRAEQLNKLDSNQFDLYVSLRTFNSSFFDVDLALSEARRVLKNRGIILLSIANGFLCVNKTILPGLILPSEEFVDIYRGINLAKDLVKNCEKYGFNHVAIYPTKTEIFICGKLSKTQNKGGKNV